MLLLLWSTAAEAVLPVDVADLTSQLGIGLAAWRSQPNCCACGLQEHDSMKRMRQGGSDRDKSVSLIDCVKVRCTLSKIAVHCKHLYQTKEIHANFLAPWPELLISAVVHGCTAACSHSFPVFLQLHIAPVCHLCWFPCFKLKQQCI